ncbi:hypothetical protein ACOMHN_058760 [Nucella lapillus]
MPQARSEFLTAKTNFRPTSEESNDQSFQRTRGQRPVLPENQRGVTLSTLVIESHQTWTEQSGIKRHGLVELMT